jgi:hypothetical protein
VYSEFVWFGRQVEINLVVNTTAYAMSSSIYFDQHWFWRVRSERVAKKSFSIAGSVRWKSFNVNMNRELRGVLPKRVVGTERAEEP